jgi:hypothetical protein
MLAVLDKALLNILRNKAVIDILYVKLVTDSDWIHVTLSCTKAEC